MRLETTARALKGAMDLMARVVPKRATTPLLETVRFDGATLRASNLVDYAEVDLSCVRAEGKAAVDFRPLAALVRHIADDDTIRLDAGAQGASLSFSGGRYDLPTVEYDEVLLNATCDRPVNIQSKAFLRGLHFCSPFICTEETRYYLNGVCIDGGKMVATDGHRLAAYQIGDDGADHRRPIIGRSTVGLLASLPGLSAMLLNNDATAAEFSLPGLRLQSRLIDGAFPNWPRVVPPMEQTTKKITVERKAFQRVLTRLQSVISYGGARAVSLAFDANRLALCGVGSPNEIVGREYVDAAVTSGVSGEAFVEFNPRYLRDVVRAFDGEETLTFHVAHEHSPIRVTGVGPRFAVLMPMRAGIKERALDTLRSWPREQRAA